MKKLSVIGIGKLGLCFSLPLEKAGYNVLGVDINPDYVNSINNRTFKSPEASVEEYLKSSSNFRATTSVEDAIKHSDILFIVVATPSQSDGRYDHGQINNLINILQSIGPQPIEKHFIVSCTTMPGRSHSEYSSNLSNVSIRGRNY